MLQGLTVLIQPTLCYVTALLTVTAKQTCYCFGRPIGIDIIMNTFVMEVEFSS